MIGNEDATIDPNRFFETKFVNKKQEMYDVATQGCWNRCVDTEAKTLEQITRDLGAVKHADGTIDWGNTSAKGTINLFTKYSPCPSCRGVIEQFKNAYPNITINVFWCD